MIKEAVETNTGRVRSWLVHGLGMFPTGHFKKCSPGRRHWGFQYKRRSEA